MKNNRNPEGGYTPKSGGPTPDPNEIEMPQGSGAATMPHIDDLISPKFGPISDEQLQKIREWFEEAKYGNTGAQFVPCTFFRVIFIKQVHSCYADSSATDAWMHREQYLPFAPQPKMVFTLPDNWITAAREVQWDGELFVVYTMPDQTIYDLQANKKPRGPSLDQLIEMWKQEHWELLGYGAHPPIETLKNNHDEEDGGE